MAVFLWTFWFVATGSLGWLGYAHAKWDAGPVIPDPDEMSNCLVGVFVGAVPSLVGLGAYGAARLLGYV